MMITNSGADPQSPARDRRRRGVATAGFDGTGGGHMRTTEHAGSLTRTTPCFYLTLHREFFEAIAAGTKKTEYREDKPFWRSRLDGRVYSEVVFRNGYAVNAPFMRVQCLRIRKDDQGRFAIALGRILEIKNYPRKLRRKPGR